MLSKSVWECFLSLTSEKTLGKPGLTAYTLSVWFDSAGWRAAYLPPEQLSNSHKQTPEPLLHIERGTAEGLPSPLHNHDLQQNKRCQYCHTYKHSVVGETGTAPYISAKDWTVKKNTEKHQIVWTVNMTIMYNIIR